MRVNLKKFDWGKVPDESLTELLHQAELRLDAMVTLALAADQRAAAFCGIFGGGAAAILALAATICSDEHVKHSLLITAICAAVCLFAGSVFFALSGRPTNFHAAGYEPADLTVSASNTRYMKGYVLADLQNRLDFNTNAAAKAARLTDCGLYCGAAAFVVGLIGVCCSR